MGATSSSRRRFVKDQRDNTSRGSRFQGWKRFVAKGDGHFEVVGEGQCLGRASADSRPAEKGNVGHDVAVDDFGVDLVTRHGLDGGKEKRKKPVDNGNAG